ncbi:hypothetical protein B7463_g8712, partial [Scytalidium lignicola]
MSPRLAPRQANPGNKALTADHVPPSSQPVPGCYNQRPGHGEVLDLGKKPGGQEPAYAPGLGQCRCQIVPRCGS